VACNFLRASVSFLPMQFSFALLLLRPLSHPLRFLVLVADSGTSYGSVHRRVPSTLSSLAACAELVLACGVLWRCPLAFMLMSHRSSRSLLGPSLVGALLLRSSVLLAPAWFAGGAPDSFPSAMTVTAPVAANAVPVDGALSAAAAYWEREALLAAARAAPRGVPPEGVPWPAPSAFVVDMAGDEGAADSWYEMSAEEEAALLARGAADAAEDACSVGHESVVDDQADPALHAAPTHTGSVSAALSKPQSAFFHGPGRETKNGQRGGAVGRERAGSEFVAWLTVTCRSSDRWFRLRCSIPVHINCGDDCCSEARSTIACHRSDSPRNTIASSYAS